MSTQLPSVQCEWRELANALSIMAPWAATLAYTVIYAASWQSVTLLVAWSAHMPCAVAYHVLLSVGHDGDVLLRFDQTMQLVAATANFIVQSEGSLCTLLFVPCALTTHLLQGFGTCHRSLTPWTSAGQRLSLLQSLHLVCR